MALAGNDLRVIGRLVQVWGLYRAAKVVGTGVWREFGRYVKYIAPAQRRKYACIWRLHENRTQRAPDYYHALCTLRGHSFTLDIAVAENVFRIGDYNTAGE